MGALCGNLPSMLIAIPSLPTDMTTTVAAVQVMVDDWLQAHPDDRFTSEDTDIARMLDHLGATGTGEPDTVWETIAAGWVIPVHPTQTEPSNVIELVRTPQPVIDDFEPLVDMLADRVFDKVMARLTEMTQPPSRHL